MTAIEYQFPGADKCVWNNDAAQSNELILNVGKNAQIALDTATRSRLIPNDHILIVGNGADRAMDHLVHDMDFDFVGTSLISGTCQTIDEGNTSTSRVCEENGSLPFISDAFDVVLCTQFLSSFESPIRRFNELLRVTKPGGSLCVALNEQPNNQLSNWLSSFRHRRANLSPSSELSSFLSCCSARRIVRLQSCDKSQALLIRK
ncbi:methyltransferase domain-containing protein [uncultured Ruegeria sp.]|uniref:class I SAM-dependent methyltransferase n=1 Tax=uncultured Ruegeria sp. TaxID=259304 RepID=UPI002628E9D3|nr:methyltransferase domain-containing protein [uncultured Ruegeria sp.]